MVPSSPKDATRAMRRQEKRLSGDHLRRYCENTILFVLISFHNTLHSQQSFCFTGLSFVLCSFGCSVFGCLIGFLKYG